MPVPSNGCVPGTAIVASKTDAFNGVTLTKDNENNRNAGDLSGFTAISND
jgi:hypothetical protein